MGKLPIMIAIFFLLIVMFFCVVTSIVGDLKNGRVKRGLIKIGSIISIVFLFKLWTGIYTKVNLPVPMGSSINKEYIINLNEKKSSDSGTKVKMDKAFMDLKNISFSVGVKGKDKLVAVEIKKNLEDKKALKAIQGLWLGGRWSYEYNAFGLPYKEDEFISTVYILCYLSNGEEVSFSLEDINNVKDKTEFVKLNENIEDEGKTLTITGFTKALSYTSVAAKSDGMFGNMELYMIVDGKEVGKSDGSYAGGGNNFDYYFSFKPIEGNTITLKLHMKNSGKEYLVQVKK